MVARPSRADAAVQKVPQQNSGADARKKHLSANCNAMSVDVEEFFQVWALSAAATRADWDNIPSRVRKSVDTTLSLFDKAGVNATFFTLGWIAERHPALVRKISDAGHEIASHGYAHVKVTEQSRDEFRADVVLAKSILEDVTGARVIGYRAPSFSIGQNNLWALDILRDTGHEYSSSVYPISHDHYGMPNASRFQFQLQSDGILEIPMSTVKAFGRNWPCAGGGYFRLLPYRYSRWAIRRINSRDQQPAVFYFHPWELDPKQPRLGNTSRRSRFRHYVNLAKTESRLEKLLTDFEWDRVDRVFLEGAAKKESVT